jgi:hypothetical protein
LVLLLIYFISTDACTSLELQECTARSHLQRWAASPKTKIRKCAYKSSINTTFRHFIKHHYKKWDTVSDFKNIWV